MLLALFVVSVTALPSPLVWNKWIGTTFPGNAYVPAPESREFAMYAAAAHDGLNSVHGYRKYTPYIAWLDTELQDTYCDDVIVAASYQALLHTTVDTRVNTDGTALLWTQAQRTAFHTAIDNQYTSFIAGLDIQGHDGCSKGVELGQAAAASVFNTRATDGFNRTVPQPYVPDFQAAKWYSRPNEAQVYPLASFEKPLSIPTPYHFTVPPPHFNLNDADYLADLAYTKDKGSNGTTTRTAAESISAQFAVQLAGARYQAAMLTGLYPRIVAADPAFDLRDYTRLQALLSLAQADSYIAVTNHKASYQYWRPWQAITRAADPAWASLYPGLAALIDPNWKSFQITPNNPEYPAGHPSASGAFAQTLRRVFGWEVIPGGPFTVVAPNPAVTETYLSVGDIEEHMVQARVFGGMHLRQSGRVGARLGQQIADYTVDNYFHPNPDPNHGNL